MNDKQTNGHSSLQNGSDGEFELMNDLPKEDPVIIERRRVRNNEITKKLGAYLLKGYCMLSDACPECDCILLRTPDRTLLCVGCSEVDAQNASNNKETAAITTTENEQRLTSAQSFNKNKDRVKRSKKRNKKASTSCEGDYGSNDNKNYSIHLENKLKWAVDELSKSQSSSRINAMCTVIVKLTESIKALKEYEMTSAQN
ncbi:unnamed protein product [Rotaria magnacalcarata]|uniref:Sjoegren syndrome/scleroderma autoantigen 1 n=1 Tax=Rotaria magnacalcarata TaxID=392030 RepID=A0A816T3S7_9BILA|nr:unnamed protein product [Rotaria magnacalcarata]CAF1490726.1 unnamed protein product [Rotaria magnacalcarata]CAF2092920.1 unnamed protein product [Rotaria magnacalcarata]CAF2094632.1 unnamed protein product [Rotaria magnacalcarata]CAF2123304.1 unnamed protein product [Rotaria magnacalcarata]